MGGKDNVLYSIIKESGALSHPDAGTPTQKQKLTSVYKLQPLNVVKIQDQV